MVVEEAVVERVEELDVDLEVMVMVDQVEEPGEGMEVAWEEPAARGV